MTLLSPNIAYAPRRRPQVEIRELCVGCYARGFTQWFYEQRGDLADCFAPGFWHDAYGMLRNGDLIVIRAKDGTALRAIAVVDSEPVLADVR